MKGAQGMLSATIPCFSHTHHNLIPAGPVSERAREISHEGNVGVSVKLASHIWSSGEALSPAGTPEL